MIWGSRHKLVGVGLCLVTTGMVVQAQVPEDDITKELEAILNAPIQGASKRTQNIIESPQAIEVLNANDIRNRGVFRIADLLRSLASVNLIERDNESTLVGIRGVMQNGVPRTVQILVDGVPLYNAELGGINIETIPIPIDLIEKVEVVRGPSSSLYGANAVAGVISISTKKDLGQESAFGRLALAGNGVKRWSFGTTYRAGGWSLIAGGAGGSQGASNSVIRPLGSPDAVPEFAGNDRGHQNLVEIRPSFDWGTGRLWVGVSKASARAERFFLADTKFPWQEFATEVSQFGIQNEISANLRYEAKVHQTTQRWTLAANPELAGQFSLVASILPTLGLSSYPEFNSNWDATLFKSRQVEVQVNWSPTARFNFVFGGDFRRFIAASSPIQGIQEEFKGSAGGGFISMDGQISSGLTFSTGARWENEKLGGARVSPRLALVYQPNKWNALRAGYYTATRSPQVLESEINLNFALPLGDPPFSQGVRQVRTLPNHGLRPEKITNSEIGYRLISDHISFDLTLFLMKFTELISSSNPTSLHTTVPSAFGPLPMVIETNSNQNMGSMVDRGLEASLTYRPSLMLSFGTSVSWLDFKPESIRVGFGSSEDNSSYAPKLRAIYWVQANKGRMKNYFSIMYESQQIVESAASFQGPAKYEKIPSRILWNMNLGYEIVKGVEVVLYGKNLGRKFTLQGAGGLDNTAFRQMRSEFGGQIRFGF